MYRKKQIDLVDKLLLARLSLFVVFVALQISLNWLLAYIKRCYSQQPKALNYRFDKSADTSLHIIELDEMWSYVGKKKNKQWIWLTQCRTTRQVIAFHIGGRTKEYAKKLWHKLPKKLQAQGLFYADDWNAYKTVFPQERHFYAKQKKDTNHYGKA